MFNSITYSEIASSEFIMAPSQLNIIDIPNKNTRPLRSFLNRNLIKSDNGLEVGSINYLSKSSHYFIRAKALQSDSYLPFLDDESFIPVNPRVFHNYNLKDGDILISKDSNIGEVVILDKDYPNYMFSGALYRLPITNFKYYVLAFIKHSYFRKQLDLMVPKGSTIRHAKTKFLNCKIPLPTSDNSNDIIKYVELLTQAIINKEIEIRNKHFLILSLIDSELRSNQNSGIFNYSHPSLSSIASLNRLDSSIYSERFSSNNFLVTNYKHGHIDLISRGFKWSRGTSLEIKGIGTRIDSDTYRPGFYELIIPANISEFGTLKKSTFIGTKSKLKAIKKGDIIFGGEGFKKGRTLVICDDCNNVVTNYHGIRIFKPDADLTETIFIRCFLTYWRQLGMIDYIGVGGSGGHCAPAYFHLIETPLFPDLKQKEIANYYHNPKSIYNPNSFTLNSFLQSDMDFNADAGIFELDKSSRLLQLKLASVISEIINDVPVNISFDFGS